MDASVGKELEGVARERAATETPPIDEVFDTHAAYVGRTLRCLGVREHELADAIQEVFLVVPGREESAVTSTGRERPWRRSPP